MNISGTSFTDAWPSDFALTTSGHASALARSTRSKSDAERRVLLISYAFPPTGGAGVQRAVKFAKYLPLYGWRPTILTVANPSTPVQDHDLAEDLDPQTPIVRARTWEPGYGVKRQLTASGSGVRATARSLLRRLAMQVLQPDPQILWNPSALREAAKALRKRDHDAILVTGPPFSSFLLGCKLKRRFGLPLVLDFRDEWILVAQHLENYQLGGFAYRRQQAMMKRALRSASAVVATTRASAAELAGYCCDAKSEATVACIYNGFDPDDLKDLSRERNDSPKLRIVYTGTLWKLTNIDPLVRALESLSRISADRAAGVELVVAGRRTPPQEAVLERLRDTGVTVVRHDYLPHRQSLQLAAAADMLLLLLDDQPGAERVVPAKLFEYMALGNPILAIGPEGETRELLRHHRQTQTFKPAQVEEIACWLMSRLDSVTEDRASGHRATSERRVSEDRASRAAYSGAPVPGTVVAEFSRPHLTGELAHVLQLCAAQSLGSAEDRVAFRSTG